MMIVIQLTCYFNFIKLINGVFMKSIYTDLGKLKTGISSSKTSDNLSEYKEKLKPETINKCTEFSKLTFAATHQINKINENKSLIKSEIQDMKALEQENEENLLSYLKELILTNGNIEFTIPYFAISQEIGHPIESEIGAREHQHFGILGDINDILL